LYNLVYASPQLPVIELCVSCGLSDCLQKLLRINQLTNELCKFIIRGKVQDTLMNEGKGFCQLSVPGMTCTVTGRMLNPTRSLTLPTFCGNWLFTTAEFCNRPSFRQGQQQLSKHQQSNRWCL